MSKNIMTNETVVAEFLKGTEVIDNHDNKVIDLYALVLFASEDKGVAGVVANAAYQSLNAVRLNNKDSKLHLSQMSIGGTVIGDVAEVETIIKYNESCTYDGCKISKVIFKDGREMTI